MAKLNGGKGLDGTGEPRTECCRGGGSWKKIYIPSTQETEEIYRSRIGSGDSLPLPLLFDLFIVVYYNKLA